MKRINRAILVFAVGLAILVGVLVLPASLPVSAAPPNCTDIVPFSILSGDTPTITVKFPGIDTVAVSVDLAGLNITTINTATADQIQFDIPSPGLAAGN